MSGSVPPAESGLSLFRSYVTVLIEAETMEQADGLLGDWLDHEANTFATWTTMEVPEDER